LLQFFFFRFPQWFYSPSLHSFSKKKKQALEEYLKRAVMFLFCFWGSMDYSGSSPMGSMDSGKIAFKHVFFRFPQWFYFLSLHSFSKRNNHLGKKAFDQLFWNRLLCFLYVFEDQQTTLTQALWDQWTLVKLLQFFFRFLQWFYSPSLHSLSKKNKKTSTWGL
jgi:hypothetical protein